MSELDEYIAANRDRYTREAIIDQLLAAGHSREDIEAAWRRSNRDAATDRGWRPGWITFVVLVAIGAIGAWLVWAEERYGGGFAVVVYVVIVVLAYALAKGLALVADRGGGVPVGIVLALGAAAGAWLSFITPGLELVALAFVVVGGIPAVLLLIRSSDPRITGTVATALPLVVWLAVTGTCYAPLYPKLVP